MPFQLCAELRSGAIHTNTYRKPAGGNTILHARSCYPKNRGIPVGELVRSKRNWSKMDSFEKRREIVTRLKKWVFQTIVT